ncbi:MAG TPA: hypothetical protein VK791_02840 [bacterium]|jgi:hypothetical protein|nr:hypothetical protein [bacterium]
MLSSRVFLIFLIGSFGLSLLTGCGVVFINQGSKASSYADNIPDARLVHKSSVPSENRQISSFADGTQYMNPYLYGAGLGYWQVLAGDGSIPNNNFISNGGVDSGRAAHIAGYLNDVGDAKYPTLALEGKFKKTGYYDLTPFHGVRFYYKSNDQAVRRRFSFGVASTVSVADGGVCTDQCGNNFGVFMKPSYDWTQQSFDFKALSREEGWGATLESDDFADHLKEVVLIKWENGTNNVPGMYRIDYWVDKVEFY